MEELAPGHDWERVESVDRQNPPKFVDGLLDTIREPLIILDGDLVVLAASRSFYRSFGVAREATEGKSLLSLGNGQWNIPTLDNLLTHIIENDTTIESFEVEHDFPLLGRKTFLLNARRVRDAEGGPTDRILLVMEDISERKRHEGELLRLALTDSLTGLANRGKFLMAMDEGLKVGRRFDIGMTLMLMDLDNFKRVNDTVGHPIGDRVLREVAEIFVSGVREVDTVARLGGDEFAVILRGMAKGEEAEVLARCYIEQVGRPMELSDATIMIGVCIGMASFPDDGDDVDSLVRRADLALYRAKAVGPGGWCTYTSDMDR